MIDHNLASPGRGTGGESPFRLLLCLACLLLPWLNPYSGGPSASVTPWLFSAACVALLYVIQPPAPLNPALPLALAGFSAWALLVSGPRPDTLALVAACLLAFMAAGSAAGGASRPRFVHAIVLAWLLAALASTALALVQYFGASERFAPWINSSAVGEAFANLRQRNQFASLTAIGMAAVFWLSSRGMARWPAAAAMAWLAVGNAATTSRTGLLQLLVLGVLAAAWLGPRRERTILWLTGLGAYAVAGLALPWLLEWSTGMSVHGLWDRAVAGDACGSRLTLWSNVLHLIAQRPWLGWGWGNLDYAHYMSLYEGLRFCDILDNAHNLPLHLAVELGVPAALLVCAGLAWLVARAKPWREAQPARQTAWTVLAVIAVHSLLEYPLWYGPFQIALGLCLGMLMPARVDRAGDLPTAGQASRALAAGAGIACAVAAWDYHRVSQIYLPPEERAPEYAADPLPKIRGSWLFRQQARFAELTITPLTRENAQWTFETASEMLRYSPEPRVIEKTIESASLLGRAEEVLLHAARFRAAFPEAYATWARAQAGSPAGRRPSRAQGAT